MNSMFPFAFRTIYRCILPCRNYNAKALVFEKYGDPKSTLQLQSVKLPPLKDNEVVVKYLASPINPSDIYYIQGTYGVRPTLPAVAGHEGVAKVLEVGKSVTSLQVGDHVLPAIAGAGTWRTHAVYAASKLKPINRLLPPCFASILAVNPCSAYRLVEDYDALQPGDVIIQNACTSAVGIYVIQFARKRGIQTINIMRPRKNPSETDLVKRQLTDFGATLVLTDTELNFPEIGEKVRSICPPNRPIKVALDCVGGTSALDLVQFLGRNGKLVCYGAISNQPMQIPAGPLIFKNVSIVGFWLSTWLNSPPSKQAPKQMMDEISNLFISGDLKPTPYEEVPLEQWKDALFSPSNNASPGLPLKKIFTFPAD